MFSFSKQFFKLPHRIETIRRKLFERRLFCHFAFRISVVLSVRFSNVDCFSPRSPVFSSSPSRNKHHCCGLPRRWAWSYVLSVDTIKIKQICSYFENLLKWHWCRIKFYTIYGFVSVRWYLKRLVFSVYWKNDWYFSELKYNRFMKCKVKWYSQTIWNQVIFSGHTGIEALKGSIFRYKLWFICTGDGNKFLSFLFYFLSLVENFNFYGI